MNRILMLTTLIYLGLSACQPRQELTLVKFQGEAQGTYYAITYYDREGRNFQTEIDSFLLAFDQVASVYVPTSQISRINSNDTTVVPDAMLTEIFERAQGFSESCMGTFDITVMPLVNAWGFGFRHQQMPDSAQVDSMLQYIGYQKVRMENGRIIKDHPNIMLDLNAIAQGYSVDQVGKWLEGKGIEHYLVDIGGEVLARGAKPDGSLWKVGIERPSADPTAERQLDTIVVLRDKALATSGNYRKFYERGGMKYSHTIDPRSGYPVTHNLLSVSVLADDATTADAYATAFMVAGTAAVKNFLETHPGLEVYMIYSDKDGSYQTWASPGFEAFLQKKESAE
ncbi:MAG TPA: FAD:protein FMN transferase [Bacteroidales bacterium]|nr:FAD:protein FMN transferase [Bacteroidales bacterium]